MLVSDFNVDISGDFACVSPIVSVIFCTKCCCKQIYFTFLCNLCHFKNTGKNVMCARI